MKLKRGNYFLHLIGPAVIFGAITGIFTAIIIVLYKFCSSKIIAISEHGYHYVRENLQFAPIILPIIITFAFIFSYTYKKHPNLSGGGIPTSIGILRGLIPFKWLINLVGVFLFSIASFFLGVPLGTEGPSVQMGTAIGMGVVRLFPKKNKAWERYSMTGGACAGFSVATGAPVSGILFSIEEAHQRVSPMIIIVSATAVMFSHLTAAIFAPLFGVSTTLFSKFEILTLSLKDIWLPIVIGIAMGIFAVLFLKYYRIINTFFNQKLKNVSATLKIFLIFLASAALGIYSFSFVSTGHELMLSLFENNLPLLTLTLILIIRSTLTLGANTNKITGGVFIPLLAIGTVLSSILAQIFEKAFSLNHDYYSVILVLGITACISGMMKMPITAIAFSIEALCCHENIFYIIVVSTTAFIVTEIFDAKSINDVVLDKKIKEISKGNTIKVIDTYIIVQPDSFAIGKQIRDIFWPANLFVLSIKRSKANSAIVDEHGGKHIKPYDILHVRYSTYNESLTREELVAIVGEQEYNEAEAKII